LVYAVIAVSSQEGQVIPLENKTFRLFAQLLVPVLQLIELHWAVFAAVLGV
jgi:hypothetical protein